MQFMYPSDGPGIVFLWQDACRCSALALVEAKHIREGSIPKAERWMVHEFPLLGSGYCKKAYYRLSERSEE
jgi:hypothetical protein